ncbi:MAG: YgiW/YdeI family stress tolerance OB fold protein [Chromatiales bacterium]
MISKIMRSSVIFATAIAASFPTALQAQNAGPSTQKAPLSVADILKSPIDDQEVVLHGVLVKKVGKEKYIFSDGTGEIRVEIEAEDFPTQKVDDKARVEIRGEVEKDFLETPEIDVEAITISP